MTSFLRAAGGSRWMVVAVGTALCLLSVSGRADIATLKNGMSVDGNWLPIGSMHADPTKGAGGNVPLKQIVVLNNQLTRTFFGTNQLAKEFTPSPAIRNETIKIQQTGSPMRRPGSQRDTLIGLGLNKIGRTREVPDTPATRGMIAKVAHLVRVVD